MSRELLFLRKKDSISEACVLKFYWLDNQRKTKSLKRVKQWYDKGIPFYAKILFFDYRGSNFETTEFIDVDGNTFISRSGTKYQYIGTVKLNK
ncbi:MAG: hypothetical protein J6C46_01340 [Clostridia bacterium]|nr:hypothetical protein [Clostridia bacterium]